MSVLERIEALDPDRDWAESYRLHAQWAFPWDVTRALETALLRTYAIPSVGDLLHATQEFEQRTQKRYDDTVLLLTSIAENGPDSEVGRAGLRQMNRIHAMFDISDEDFSYVLSTFVAVPARWIERFGWRAMTANEQALTHRYWAEVGKRMGIKGLPGTFAETLEFSTAYEKQHFARTRGTAAVGDATRELFVQWFRPVPAPVVRMAVTSLVDDDVCAAFGWAPAPAPVQRVAVAALRARAQVVRRLPDRRRPVAAADSRLVRSYPDGFTVDELGPTGTPLPGASEPRARV